VPGAYGPALAIGSEPDVAAGRAIPLAVPPPRDEVHEETVSNVRAMEWDVDPRGRSAVKGALDRVRLGHRHLGAQPQQPDRSPGLAFGDQGQGFREDDRGIGGRLRQGAAERLGEKRRVPDLDGEPDGGAALPRDIRQPDELTDRLVDLLRFGEVALEGALCRASAPFARSTSAKLAPRRHDSRIRRARNPVAWRQAFSVACRSVNDREQRYVARRLGSCPQR
jgi:hypothetical protein